MKYETVIGLEIHAQLLTKTKLFCSCPIAFGAKPNTKTCPICLGLPGSLPVLNENAASLALRAALALNCRISKHSVFARKNYFYPDLPKGYQISQFDKPLAENGWVEIKTQGKTKKIGITRIHIEEDAGKLIHENNEDFSYVDYNRSCVPLIEIVSEPDISSSQEAEDYLRTLRNILIENDVCDGNMELGNLRCDANISLKKPTDKKLGTKTELKNMNSFNFIRKALDYEKDRQAKLLDEGKRVIQQTLLYDQKNNITQPMRSKEEAHDYRYFEEPDLLPLVIKQSLITTINTYFLGSFRKILSMITSQETLPKEYYEQGLSELNGLDSQKETLLKSPFTLQAKIHSYQKILDALNEKIKEEKIRTYVNNYGLSFEQARLINENEIIAKYFLNQKIFEINPKQSATFFLSILIPVMNEREEISKNIDHYLEFVKEVNQSLLSKTINFNTAKEVLTEALKSNKNPLQIIKGKGLEQISDESDINTFIDQILISHKNEVEEYKRGKEPLFNFLFGQLMKISKGKVNPGVARERLKDKLKA